MKKIFCQKKSELNPTKLKNIKLIVIFSVVGIAAIILFFSGNVKPAIKSETPVTETTMVEKRLEEILSRIKGAGNVRVMIVFKDDGKENIAMNKEYSQDSDGSVKTQTTAVLGENKEVVVIQKSIPEVQGVIVTAQGANCSEVRENIKKAIFYVLVW